MDEKAVTRRATRLLDTVRYIVIGTTTPDGNPWTTPVLFARQGRSFFWSSRIDAQHSENIRHNPAIFLVAFDATTPDASGHAVYVRAVAVELNERDAVETGLRLINGRRDNPLPDAAAFLGPARQRVFRATAQTAWTNVLHDADDVPWDERIEIALQDSAV
jgi:nitroimidazol reductase NimA-like FMN-containing flavoprotein (pyridoxamine 5'-phosphate oxidase superfamily)